MFTTKDHVLCALIKADGHLSGEAVSEELGISRAAVNSAVKSLRAEGYVIDSSTKKGYILTSVADNINYGSLLARLPGSRVKNIICLPEVDSTNRYLKDLAFDGVPSGTVVISETQTKGRGRRGRSFCSPEGTGIYLSYLFRPAGTDINITDLTSIAAVAVCNCIEKVTGIRPDIKWVNDILMNDRKICGILTELSIESETGSVESAVIGIGININETEDSFPEELHNIAGSVRMASGKKIDRSEVAGELISELDHLLSGSTKRENILQSYRRSCITVGREISAVKVHDSTDARHGKALEVNDDFSLKVRFEDGSVEDLISGEVSVRGLYGYV
ncbi:MAG: biotin--[acetyl-CoA-carboxylase] ligase [Clostridiales bacterium]|nr:biotin--[acetyl-CoA-carboxylase] ligase [Clostridiales bacterium]